MLSLALLVTAYIAFLSTLNGQGPFAARSAEENALALQLYLITISLPLMFLATLIRERRDNHDALLESEARYRALVMAEANIVWQANANGDRKSVVKGKSGSVRVDLGGRRSIK